MFYFAICVHNLPATQLERERKHCLFIYLSASYLKDFFSIKKQNQLNIHKPIRQRKEKSKLFFLLCILYRIPDLLSGQWLLFLVQHQN